MTGDFGATEAPDSSSGRWLGLFPTSHGFQVKEARVRVVDSSGISVLTDQPEDPVFLFRGIPSIHESDIKTLFQGDMFLEPSQEIEFDLSEENHYIVHAGEEDSLYLVSIEHDLTYQDIARISDMDEENEPHILWIGDLDQDNKIDFFVYLPDGRYGGKFVLYLSSYADPGNLFNEVATFEIQGD